MKNCKFFIPLHCPVGPDTLETLGKTEKLALEYLSIPLIIKRSNFLFTTQHIVHVLVKKEKKSETIEFFDSKGYPLTDYPEVQKVIDMFSKKALFLEHKKPTQSLFDPINCGAYLLSYLEQRMVQGLPFTESVQKPLGGIMRFRFNLAQKLSQVLAIPPENPEILDDWEILKNDEIEHKDAQQGKSG